MRKIYPEQLFERRAKYEIPVFMSRHPDLNQYIARVLGSARTFLEKGALERFVVLVSDSR
jgi:mitotic spindle assembly checkpoint protein MAD2B